MVGLGTGFDQPYLAKPGRCYLGDVTEVPVLGQSAQIGQFLSGQCCADLVENCWTSGGTVLLSTSGTTF
ncbi:hypothetical protein NHF46_17325 [Arthrobacter alpinus]|nr:hypothetical protein [Arthrobacter alpinus]